MDEFFAEEVEAAFSAEGPTAEVLSSKLQCFLPSLKDFNLMGEDPTRELGGRDSLLSSTSEVLSFDIRDLMMGLLRVPLTALLREPTRVLLFLDFVNRGFLRLWVAFQARSLEPAQLESVIASWSDDVIHVLIELAALCIPPNPSISVTMPVEESVEESSKAQPDNVQERSVSSIPIAAVYRRVSTLLSNVYFLSGLFQVCFVSIVFYGVLSSVVGEDNSNDGITARHNCINLLRAVEGDEEKPVFGLIQANLLRFSKEEENQSMFRDYESGRANVNLAKKKNLFETNEAVRQEWTVLTEDVEEIMPTHPPLYANQTFVIGALSLLVDSLHEASCGVTSPKKVLELFLPFIRVALSSPLGAELRVAVKLLREVVERVPRFSFRFTGETFSVEEFIGQTDYASQYHTPLYQYCFEACRCLVTLSTENQDALVRTEARECVVRLIGLLHLENRLQLYFSLIHLCPYASVTMFLLQHLVNEWEEGNGTTKEGSAFHREGYETEFPLKLMECVTALTNHLCTGEKDFLDPVIVCLNFFFRFLSRDAKQAEQGGGTARLCWRDGKVLWKEGKQISPWEMCVGRIKKIILPRLQTLLSSPTESTVEKKVMSFTAVTLSPLDAFTLESSLTRVTQFFGE